MIFDCIIGQCCLCGAKNIPVAVLGDRDESGPLLACRSCLEDAMTAVNQWETRERVRPPHD